MKRNIFITIITIIMITKIELDNINTYNNIALKFSDKRRNKWYWIDDYILSLDKSLKILDIGCGNGRNMEYDDYDFYGIDNCKNFISICKDKKLNVKLSDMTNIIYEDNCFDSIISIASFHHLSTRERRLKALAEMKRVLKQTGSVLLSIWSKNQSHNKKLNFNYGDNYVPWKSKDGIVISNRYYYIFEIMEIKELLLQYFKIDKHFWCHGNDIFILHNK